MNKKLLPLAIAAALGATASVAQAEDITIYGTMHFSADYIDGNPAFVGGDSEDWDLGSSRNTRIGVKGSEDLGNGLKAIFKIESTAMGDAASTVGSRNTYAGLSGDWGTVLMGRHDTPYKIATGNLDMFGDTIADYNNVIGTIDGAVRFDERAAQTVAYISPNMNGLTLAGALVSVDVDEGAGNEETQAVSLAAMYSNGPFFGSLAYEAYDDGASGLLTLGGHGDGAQNSDAWKLGLGYKANNFSVGFVYEWVYGNDHDADGLGDDQENWMLNAGYAFGNNEVKVQYANADLDVVNADYETWTIGLDHNLSKRTKVYALYTSMDNDVGGFGVLDQGVGGAFGLPGGNNNTAANLLTGDQDAVSFGIVHNF